MSRLSFNRVMHDSCIGRRLAGAGLLCSIAAFVAGARADNTDHPIEIRSAIAITGVGGGGRRPVHADPIQAQLIDGTLAAPHDGTEVMLPNGEVRTWQTIEAGAHGGFEGAPIRSAYVFARVNADSDGIMLLDASGHSMVYVNGEPRVGDPYKTGIVRLPIKLQHGENHFLFRTGRRAYLRATLQPLSKGVFINTSDPTLPDIIHSEPSSSRAALVVVNATERAQNDLVIKTSGGGLPTRETNVPPIPPLSVRKVAFWCGGALPDDMDSTSINVVLSSHADDDVTELDRASLRLRVRHPLDTHNRTFASDIDGSVQYYSVTPARPAGDDRADALVLTLHGAGVQAQGQARSYANKEWCHIVAPTNRRPYGFDWEDWGRMDAIEVLELNQKRLDIDPTRVYLTGHSMGGHGTWHVGVTFPDRFAAIGPSAGWSSFWSYTRAAEWDDTVSIEQMFKRAVTPSRTLDVSRNYLQHGIYILHGANDDNVPPQQARDMYAHLSNSKFHPDVVYHEQPEAGHWWGNRCVDWPEMFEFFRERTNETNETADAVSFVTANPEISSTSHWVSIEAQSQAMTLSSVDITVDRATNTFSGATDNVARLAFEVNHLSEPEAVSFNLDGQSIVNVERPKRGQRIWLARDGKRGDGPWRALEHEPEPDFKGPHRYGPFKNAFRNHMIFVYGTQGTDEENAWAFARARYDAETFWYRGNGSIDVIPDLEFKPDRDGHRNVILFGNAQTNAAWRYVLGDAPVYVSNDSIRVGDRTFEGEDLATIFIYPRAGTLRASVGVVSGTGIKGMRMTDRLPYFVSGVAYPDVVVFGPETPLIGEDGILAAGFFGLDWSVENGEIAVREEYDQDPKHMIGHEPGRD